jgi:hypothetical protein
LTREIKDGVPFISLNGPSIYLQLDHLISSVL